MSESSTKMPICQNEPHSKQYTHLSIYANDKKNENSKFLYDI